MKHSFLYWRQWRQHARWLAKSGTGQDGCQRCGNMAALRSCRRGPRLARLPDGPLTSHADCGFRRAVSVSLSGMPAVMGALRCETEVARACRQAGCDKNTPAIVLELGGDFGVLFNVRDLFQTVFNVQLAAPIAGAEGHAEFRLRRRAVAPCLCMQCSKSTARSAVQDTDPALPPPFCLPLRSLCGST